MTRAREDIGARRRFLLLQRDGFACQFCSGRPGHDRLHLDHVIPHAQGGSSHDNNLATACDRCNAGKGNQIAVPPSWCAGPLLEDGFRPWKRWQRWSLLWAPDSALLVLDDSDHAWVDIARVHDRALHHHLRFKFTAEHGWPDLDGVPALAGLDEAWEFARTLIRRPE